MDKSLAQDKFANLTFADFKSLAMNNTLSSHEKVGFPNTLRAGKEKIILSDILNKLTLLNSQHQVVLDIGPGCSEFTMQLIDVCKVNEHKLILIDSEEMLQQLPDEKFIIKIPAFYPDKCQEFISQYRQKINVILSYSVLQYIFVETNLFKFLDETLSLLMEGGQLLLGDIPNTSKRKRFLSSAKGRQHHKQFYAEHPLPEIKHLVIESQQIDDAVLMGMLMRCRQAGFDAYLMPQGNELPMANRREDLLVVKP